MEFFFDFPRGKIFKYFVRGKTLNFCTIDVVQINFNLTILGNGSAMPHKERNPSSQYLTIDQNVWLIDCGENTQFRLLKYGLKRSKIQGIVISHLHADHYLGLFGLLSSMSMDRRKKKLIIAGHSLLQQMIELHFSHGNFELGFDLDFISLDQLVPNDVLYDQKYFQVSVHPVKHRIPCWAFKFSYKRDVYHLDSDKIKGLPVEALQKLSNGENFTDTVRVEDYTELQCIDKTYVYCTDTIKLPAIEGFANGANALYHETTFLADNSKRAEETFHSTTEDAANLAKEAQVGELIIGHFSSRYDDVSVFLDQTQAIFENSNIAIEGKTFKF